MPHEQSSKARSSADAHFARLGTLEKPAAQGDTIDSLELDVFLFERHGKKGKAGTNERRGQEECGEASDKMRLDDKTRSTRTQCVL